MTVSEAWCRTYTRLVPPEEAERRRAEVASHVHDAREAGVPRGRLALQGVVGAGADLAWSDRVRRRRGLLPLAVVPFVDATTGAVLAGPVVLLAFAWSVFLDGGVERNGGDVLSGLALLLVCSGHIAALLRRRGR